MQQTVRLSHVMYVGRRRAQAVDYVRLRVHPDVRLHSEMPLVPLLSLMHRRVPFPGAVLGGRRGLDDAGVHDGSLPQPQPLGLQVGVDLLQQALSQAVPFQKMAEIENGGLVGQGPGQFQTNEPAHRFGLVEQSLPP